MWLQDAEDSALTEGLSEIEAEFYTDHLVLSGEVASPERRLSDHLNSPTFTVEVNPSRVERTVPGSGAEIKAGAAYISKSHLLFVVPLNENVREPDQTEASRPTIVQACSALVGRYSLRGKVHAPAARGLRSFLRSLENRQFFPMTDAVVVYPDGSEHRFPAVLINRFQMEILALEAG